MNSATRTRSGNRAVYLTKEHFIAMLLMAAAVHLVALIIAIAMPKTTVNQIPVHVLNIKLASGDVSAMTNLAHSRESSRITAPQQAQQAVAVPPPHEHSRSEPAPVAAPVEHMQPEAVVQAPAPAPKAKAATALPAPAKQGVPNKAQHYAAGGSAASAPYSAAARPSQFVRSRGDAHGSGGDGSVIGNSLDPQAEVMHRYTQLISMWVNRQNAILNRALQPGMKGNIVLRLRIDRQGNILHFKLDKATGVPVVDSAAADMVRAANPVPPMPANYPGGNMFEFLISVGYTYDQ